MKKQLRFRQAPHWQPKLLSLAVGLASAVAALPAQAIPFKFVDDEITGSFDTTLSYGSLWRVTGPHPENIGLANGGTKPNVNFDNGDLNYKRGEQVSSIFRMSNELDLNYKNFGAFVRVLSFYDGAIQGKSFNPNRADDRVIKNRLGHDYEIFDAYIRGNFKVADRNLNVRLGKQVVSWGESTFIPNGINIINPVDVVRLRAPGAELKDAFLPVHMAWASQELSDTLTVEAFNQFGWRPTRLEPNGSYFSTNDFLSPGGERVVAGAATPDQPGLGAIPRAADVRARDRNQYGLALRKILPELNNTELAFYYINYHSRTPFASGTTGSTAFTGTPRPFEARYFAEYPENIRLFGLSFNTLGPFGVALQGEYSYRPNMPLQIAATDLLTGLLTQGLQPGLSIGIPPTGTGTNATVSGFERVKFHQFQMTATQTFGPQLGANQLVGVMEAGYTYMDLPNTRNGAPIAFNGNGVDRLAIQQVNGVATRNSYGYRLVLRAEYLNALGPVNLTPRLAFSHDLRGTSPTFAQSVQAATVGVTANYLNNWQADLSYTNFFGGEKFVVGPAGTTPLTVSSNNPLSDRDFVAATVSYSF